MADNYNTLVLMFGQGNAFEGTEVDYDSFMEEFRKDYSRQIALTAEQLKKIMDNKDVNGKGEQLSEAMKITLEKRLSKTIERNRDVYGSRSHLISPEILTLIKKYQETGELPKPETPQPEIIQVESVPVEERIAEVKTGEIAAEVPTEESVAKTELMAEEPETEPAAEEPSVEEPETEPAIEEPLVEEPAIEEPAVKELEIEPAIEEPSVKEPVPAEQPREVGDEYLKYGDMSVLADRYVDSDNACVKELLLALENYEEVMEMCVVEEIQNAIMQAKTAAQAVCDAEGQEQEFVDFAVRVAEQFTLEEESVPGLVKWCVLQGKIRQAAEVYAELMPEYFFDREVIYYEDFRENKKNDGSYGDSVIDARKQAKSKRRLKYFWLNEMLWKNHSKKLFLNVDKPILEHDGANARRFKMAFREIKELQETKKNHVKADNLPEDVAELFEMIAKGSYISPVLNTVKKVCNYFFNYESTGAAGSVQKSYRELAMILLSNRAFSEEYFGEESAQIVTYTPASAIMDKEQHDVKSRLSVTELEKTLRIYESVKEQAALMGTAVASGVKRKSKGELVELLLSEEIRKWEEM